MKRLAELLLVGILAAVLFGLVAIICFTFAENVHAKVPINLISEGLAKTNIMPKKVRMYEFTIDGMPCLATSNWDFSSVGMTCDWSKRNVY